MILKDPNSKIRRTKEEKVVKLHERYNIFNYFVLKDNELYYQEFKVRQSKRLVMCDYSVAIIIQKVYTQLEHTKNLKSFAIIK